MYSNYYNSPIGIIKVISDETSIIDIDIVEKMGEEKSNKVIIDCINELQEYFNNKRKIFSFSFKLIGTDFQKKVWNELLNIPYGESLSYKEVAKNIGNERGVRAVANAIGRNKLLIVIPCHRVIGTNKTLTGFRAGIPTKEYLLNLEGINNYKK